MRLDATTVATVDLEQLVVALRRWYEGTGDARPNQLLGELGRLRGRSGGAVDEQLERGLLLLTVQRHGPLEIPDPAGPPPEGFADASFRSPYSRRRTSAQGGNR